MISKGIMPKGFRIESLRVEENNIKGILVTAFARKTEKKVVKEQKRQNLSRIEMMFNRNLGRLIT